MLMLRFISLSVLLIVCNGQDYCPAGPTTTVDSNLGPVYLAGNSMTIDDQTNCPGFIGVKDLTNLKADLTPSQNTKFYTLTFQVTTCGNSFPTLAGAWIDYNQNKVYDPEELVGAFTTQKGVVSIGFSVPQNAVQGQTRMRVQVQETQATNLTPCASFPYGATKDFGIQIGSGRTCPSGPATTEDMNLGSVYLMGDLLDINDLTDCPGQIGPIDLRSQVADLVRGSRYTLRYNVTTCGLWWPVRHGAWVDWSRDGLYTNDELLFPLSSQTGVVEQSFVIPTGDWYGDITMRVQVQETNANTIDPCADFPYGGTKDFTLRLKSEAETYCQSGPLQLSSTALGSVRVIGATSTIVSDTACPGAIGPQDFTSQIADMNVGGVYTLIYNVVNCSATQNQIITSAWIDFDQNFQFSNWEQIILDNPRYGEFTANFKVPVSTPTQQVKNGRTRFRIQTQVTTASDIFACDQFQFGGTKDASVVISGGQESKEE